MRYFTKQEIEMLNLLTESELDGGKQNRDWKNDSTVKLAGVLLDGDKSENVYNVDKSALFPSLSAEKRIFGVEEVLARDLVVEFEIEFLTPHTREMKSVKEIGYALIKGEKQTVYQVNDLELRQLVLYRSDRRKMLWDMISTD